LLRALPFVQTVSECYLHLHLDLDDTAELDPVRRPSVQAVGEAQRWIMNKLLAESEILTHALEKRVSRMVLRLLLDHADELNVRSGGGGASLARAVEEQIERWKLLLAAPHPNRKRDANEIDVNAQYLFECQAFCAYHGWPPGLVPSLFKSLFDSGVVCQQAVFFWRDTPAGANDDEHHVTATPGRERTIAEAKEFLAWLVRQQCAVAFLQRAAAAGSSVKGWDPIGANLDPPHICPNPYPSNPNPYPDGEDEDEADREAAALNYGRAESPAPEPKLRRILPNDPCTCGSGRKYKKCCGVGGGR